MVAQVLHSQLFVDHETMVQPQTILSSWECELIPWVLPATDLLTTIHLEISPLLPLKKTEPTDPPADHTPEHIVHLPVWTDDDESHRALGRPHDADIQEMLASPLPQSVVEPVLPTDLVLAVFVASVSDDDGLHLPSSVLRV